MTQPIREPFEFEGFKVRCTVANNNARGLVGIDLTAILHLKPRVPFKFIAKELWGYVIYPGAKGGTYRYLTIEGVRKLIALAMERGAKQYHPLFRRFAEWFEAAAVPWMRGDGRDRSQENDREERSSGPLAVAAPLGPKPGDRRMSPFDAIRHIDDQGEYWLARELMKGLGYEQWRRFEAVVAEAMAACKSNGDNIEHHFANVGKMIQTGKGAKRKVAEYRLSRAACYMVALSADGNKDEVAAAKRYFADMTRKQEVGEALSAISAAEFLSLMGRVRELEEQIPNLKRQIATGSAGISAWDRLEIGKNDVPDEYLRFSEFADDEIPAALVANMNRKAEIGLCKRLSNRLDHNRRRYCWWIVDGYNNGAFYFHISVLQEWKIIFLRNNPGPGGNLLPLFKA